MGIILPATYFGTVEHYLLLAKGAPVIVDTGEHYLRQSYRTRTRIVGPNGPQDLNVFVQRDHGSKQPMHGVRLAYDETWPQQHLHAIRSAYGKTAWFIHYIDALEEVLMAKHEKLVDLDLATMRLALRWLGLDIPLTVSQAYVEPSTDDLDLRERLSPKAPLPEGLPSAPEYTQVFADRHGFLPRLSVLDLVMNIGPMAKRYIRQ